MSENVRELEIQRNHNGQLLAVGCEEQREPRIQEMACLTCDYRRHFRDNNGIVSTLLKMRSSCRPRLPAK